MPRNNRSAGNRYELEEATALKESGLFPFVVTCRSENRSRDGQKVDLINRDEPTNGRMEYNFQCKNSAKIQNYHTILSGMPQMVNVMNVILHKYTQKRGRRFMTKGHYATLNRKDFFQLMKYRKALDILTKIIEHLPEPVRSQANNELHKIGL